MDNEELEKYLNSLIICNNYYLPKDLMIVLIKFSDLPYDDVNFIKETHINKTLFYRMFSSIRHIRSNCIKKEKRYDIVSKVNYNENCEKDDIKHIAEKIVSEFFDEIGRPHNAL